MRELHEALAERPVHERQYSSTRRTTDCGLHSTSAGGRQYIHGPLRLEHVAHSGLYAREDLVKLRAAVRYRLPQHRLQDVLSDFGRAGKEKCARLRLWLLHSDLPVRQDDTGVRRLRTIGERHAKVGPSN